MEFWACFLMSSYFFPPFSCLFVVFFFFVELLFQPPSIILDASPKCRSFLLDELMKVLFCTLSLGSIKQSATTYYGTIIRNVVSCYLCAHARKPVVNKMTIVAK